MDMAMRMDMRINMIISLRSRCCPCS
jgi:hypothetical protein